MASNKKNNTASTNLIMCIMAILLTITVVCTLSVTAFKKAKETPTDAPITTQSDVSSKEEASQEVSSLAEISSQAVSSAAASEPDTSSKTFTPQGIVSPTNTDKICYLTFDDGPSNNTLKVLDILKQYNIKATFFVVGSSKLEYTKRIVAEGHTVGLHANVHEYSKIYRSVDAYFSDLNEISKKVEAACGVKSNIIRFPGGTSNTVSRSHCSGIMTTLAQEVVDRGYYYFDWNADSNDASGNNVPVSKIMSSIRAYGTSSDSLVVLMHDTGAKNTTVEALPQIIEFYANAGYSFAALSSDSEPIRHRPNN